MSSRLLEIFGRAIQIDASDIIWEWLDITNSRHHDINKAAAEHIDEIISLVRRKEYEKAETELRLYLFDNPDCNLGRMAAAAICLGRCDIDSAINELNSVYVRQPSNTMALYCLGHCYERKGCEEQAIEFYQDCIKFRRYLQLPTQRMAAIYYKNGQIEKAIEEYENLRKDFPDDTSFLNTLGHLYMVSGNADRAIDMFNTAILIHPDNFDQRDEHTEQLVLEGRFEEAAECLQILVNEDPDNVDYLVRYGDVLGFLGFNDESIEKYEQVVSIRPSCLEARIKLGTSLVQEGRFSEAAFNFNYAYEINEMIIDSYIGLALGNMAKGNEKQTLNNLSLASAIMPNSLVLLSETAILEFKLENQTHHNFEQQGFEQGGNVFEKIIRAHLAQIETQDNNPDVYYRLGQFVLNMGKAEEGLKYLEKAIEINPTYYRARNKLSLAYMENGYEDKAVETLAGPVCTDRETLGLYYKTSMLYCDKIKFAYSMMNLDNQLEENYANCNCSYNISIVLQNMGLIDRTNKMLENLRDTARQAQKMT